MCADCISIVCTSCPSARTLHKVQYSVLGGYDDIVDNAGTDTTYQVADGAADSDVIVDSSTPPDWLVRRWAECSVQATRQREVRSRVQ
jgi:hypothetical protein